MTTRAEHLAWCKARALEHLDAGDPVQAMASMASDLTKWEGGPLYDSELLRTMWIVGLMDAGSPDRLRRWIEGFN